MLRQGTSPQAATTTPTAARWRHVLGVVLTIVVVLGAATWIFAEVIRPRVRVKNFGEVEPGVYRSGQVTHHVAAPAFRELDVDVVIAMNLEPEDHAGQAAEQRAAEAMGIERYCFPMKGDGTGDPQQYVEGITKLVEARREGKTVLVHCASGAQRTSGLFGLYRVLVQKQDPARAVREMREYRHDPRDNPDLLPFLNEHIGFIARQLAERGIIDRVPDPLPQFPLE